MHKHHASATRQYFEAVSWSNQARTVWKRCPEALGVVLATFSLRLSGSGASSPLNILQRASNTFLTHLGLKAGVLLLPRIVAICVCLRMDLVELYADQFDSPWRPLRALAISTQLSCQNMECCRIAEDPICCRRPDATHCSQRFMYRLKPQNGFAPKLSHPGTSKPETLQLKTPTSTPGNKLACVIKNKISNPQRLATSKP